MNIKNFTKRASHILFKIFVPAMCHISFICKNKICFVLRVLSWQALLCYGKFPDNTTSNADTWL